MVRKLDPSINEFQFKFKYSWEENFGVPKAVQAVLWFLFTVALIAGILYGVYWLHIKEYIEVPVPKFLRRGYLKDYLSRAEKKEVLEEVQRKR
jgi:hypothetical protein